MSMEQIIDLGTIFIPSEDVITAVVDDGLLLVPLISGMADFEDGIISLNEAGYLIWNQFDGEKTIKQIIQGMAEGYDVSMEEIKLDVLGLVKELVGGRVLVEKRAQ